MKNKVDRKKEDLAFVKRAMMAAGYPIWLRDTLEHYICINADHDRKNKGKEQLEIKKRWAKSKQTA
jgi:hypothetical protein